MIGPENIRALRAIDWDFATSRRGYVAPPHWYPGTFIPALSDAVIEAIVPTGGKVFDPYGGIGTTGWSAIRTGRTCQICDCNPVALLVSYVSIGLLALVREQPRKAKIVIDKVGRLSGGKADLFDFLGVWEEGGDEVDGAVATLCKPRPDEFLPSVVVGPPNWNSLQAWFAPETRVEMEQLVTDIQSVDGAFARCVAMCMLSAVARNISSQHASWGHIADNVRPKQFKVQSVRWATTQWLKRLGSFLSLPSARNGGPDGLILDLWQSDWSREQRISRKGVDLLLTSPPYADAIDYTLSQRLSLYLFGYDDCGISNLVSGEIGARRKRFISDSRSNWSEALCHAFRVQVECLKPDGAILLVLPHRDSGRGDGLGEIKQTLVELGWNPFFERDRSIHQSRTRQSWTSIKRETIIGFSRGESL